MSLLDEFKAAREAGNGGGETPKESLFDKFTNINFTELWKVVPSDYSKAQFTRFECDDAGGIMNLILGPGGDTHLSVGPHPRAREVGHMDSPSIRVRTYQGGGRSHRVRKAMLLLMLAVIEDSQER